MKLAEFLLKLAELCLKSAESHPKLAEKTNILAESTQGRGKFFTKKQTNCLNSVRTSFNGI